MDEDKTLTAYIKTINELDDYFEYRCESKKDRAFVYKTIENLSRELQRIKSVPEET